MQPLEATTWSDAFPIGKTVELPEFSDRTLKITQSGTPNGYVLYTPASGRSATIDVGKSEDFNIVLNAKYVIVRGLTLKGARRSAILLGPTAKANSADISDVVIEKNDISGWGRNDPKCAGKRVVHGVNLQAAIYAFSDRLQRVIIQRNRLHHPSTGANSWKEENCSGTGSKHPLGPQGITIRNSLGNLVIRYNEIYSDDQHGFNDAMGDVNNFSKAGFPRRDSDIYGNLIRNAWDDGIEAEGAGQNVRIWGNYIDQVMVPIALAPVSVGPVYVWKNLSHVSRSSRGKSHGAGFIKSRPFAKDDAPGQGGGRVYLFNNTSLSPRSGAGTASFLAEFNRSNRLSNYRTLNNIMGVQNPEKNYSIKDGFGMDNAFDYDLLEGRTRFSRMETQQELHGVKGTAKFVPQWGLDEATKRGNFSLMPSSAGYDQGTVIPNFMDHFTGAAPDIGAHESQTPAMEFGVNAYTSSTQ